MHPPPNLSHLFSAPSAPFSTLSPRQHSQDVISSPPWLPGPWDLPSFDHTAAPHCLPAGPQLPPALAGGVPALLPASHAFALPVPQPRGPPLALCRSEFRHNWRLSSRHQLPPSPSHLRGLHSGPCSPSFLSWRGTPRTGLGSVGPPWATPRSSQVASMGGEELTSQQAEPLQPSVSSQGLAHPSVGPCHSAPSMLASTYADSHFLDTVGLSGQHSDHREGVGHGGSAKSNSESQGGQVQIKQPREEGESLCGRWEEGW